MDDEHNVCIYDARVAAEFERIFASDLAACDRVEMAARHKRGVATKTLEGLASLLKEQV